MMGLQGVRAALAGLALLALWGCGSMPATVANQPVVEPKPAAIGAAYRLGAGDKLLVNVFNEPELSGPVVVDGRGMVSLPLVGEVAAQGSTVADFRARVRDALSQGFLNDPQVVVEVMNFRPYYILGEIEKPGEYAYVEGMTVMNAVASAGGFTYRANKRTVFIKRAGEPDEQRVDLTSGLLVGPGDTVRIGERFF